VVILLVVQYCLSDKALAIYKTFLSSHLQHHNKGNKLRDVPARYVEEGHCFSTGDVERELIYSFDVCGGCEAHAIMNAMGMNASDSSGRSKGDKGTRISSSSSRNKKNSGHASIIKTGVKDRAVGVEGREKDGGEDSVAMTIETAPMLEETMRLYRSRGEGAATSLPVQFRNCPKYDI
jgi:hypothetical protein